MSFGVRILLVWIAMSVIESLMILLANYFNLYVPEDVKSDIENGQIKQTDDTPLLAIKHKFFDNSEELAFVMAASTTIFYAAACYRKAVEYFFGMDTWMYGDLIVIICLLAMYGFLFYTLLVLGYLGEESKLDYLVAYYKNQYEVDIDIDITQTTENPL